MAVKIRLSRIGKKHAPFYRIVATDSRTKRDGAFLEDLGTYDTLQAKMVTLKSDRVDYWISVGAIPTDSFSKVHTVHKRSLKTAAPQEQASVEAKPEKKKATSKQQKTNKAA